MCILSVSISAWGKMVERWGQVLSTFLLIKSGTKFSVTGTKRFALGIEYLVVMLQIGSFSPTSLGDCFRFCSTYHTNLCWISLHINLQA